MRGGCIFSRDRRVGASRKILPVGDLGLRDWREEVGGGRPRERTYVRRGGNYRKTEDFSAGRYEMNREISSWKR